MSVSKIVGGAVCAIAISSVLPAAAATITIDSRYYDGSATFTNSASYVSEWLALASSPPTSGYGLQTVTNWDGSQSNAIFGSNTNIAFHDQVTFTVSAAQAGIWSFRIGPDFGYGGTLLVDGAELQTQTKNLWWAGNITDPYNTLSGSLTLSAGTHTLNVYGFEDGNDGGTIGQFEAPGSSGFANFAVPEPASWALMLVGFGALGAAIRRRRSLVAA